MSAPTNSALGTVQYSTATPASHAALIAEVTALRDTLNDAVEMVESLRSERDTKQRACDALKDHIDQQTNDAVRLRSERDALHAACERTLDLLDQPSTRLEIAGTMRAALGRSA